LRPFCRLFVRWDCQLAALLLSSIDWF